MLLVFSEKVNLVSGIKEKFAALKKYLDFWNLFRGHTQF